jgi:hypothetical protein
MLMTRLNAPAWTFPRKFYQKPNSDRRRFVKAICGKKLKNVHSVIEPTHKMPVAEN